MEINHFKVYSSAVTTSIQEPDTLSLINTRRPPPCPTLFTFCLSELDSSRDLVGVESPQHFHSVSGLFH